MESNPNLEYTKIIISIITLCVATGIAYWRLSIANKESRLNIYKVVFEFRDDILNKYRNYNTMKILSEVDLYLIKENINDKIKTIKLVEKKFDDFSTNENYSVDIYFDYIKRLREIFNFNKTIINDELESLISRDAELIKFEEEQIVNKIDALCFLLLNRKKDLEDFYEEFDDIVFKSYYHKNFKEYSQSKERIPNNIKDYILLREKSKENKGRINYLKNKYKAI